MIHPNEITPILDKMGKVSLVLDIKPRSGSRFKFNRKTGIPFVKKEYKEYKASIVDLVRDQYRPDTPENIWAIRTRLYWPYPKSYKEERIEGQLYRAIGDSDGYRKGLYDGLEEAGALANDRDIVYDPLGKYRTIEAFHRIEVDLFYIPKSMSREELGAISNKLCLLHR